MDGWERVGCSLGRACTHAPLSNDGRRTQEVSPKDAAGSPQQMELHGPGRVVLRTSSILSMPYISEEDVNGPSCTCSSSLSSSSPPASHGAQMLAELSKLGRP